VLAFDNLSGIHPNYSDALCKIATGDNQRKILVMDI